MTVLVTGASGLLGAALVRSFAADAGVEVLAAVRSPARAEAMFEALSNVRIVQWDVMRPAELDGYGVDYIVHAAAETGSRAFVERPVDVIRTTVDGVVNVLDLARARKVRGLVFLSTMEVYGSPTADPVTELDYGYLDPASVRSSYPESKRLAESLCVAHAREYGVPVKIARLTQTFGEGVRKGDGRVFAQFAEAVAAKRDIVLHTQGNTARCYCYLGDAVEAIRAILFRGQSGEAYNVANPETYCTIREMAEMLARRYPPVRVVVDLAGAAGRGYAPEFRMRLSVAKTRALGWTPKVGLMEAFERMIAYWRLEP